ncbi:hypothetical protein EYR41_004670 [Orbilia oligospora]|uniref:Uncharacterized protein n=1 Tax=Orbilia oligospora TaxID=2813651 RepID=A0A7C8PBC9_ORBOL|nr:hypothetical protein TWF751_011223 [Orbilia oligospora]TGJ72802.1 hypothetical protein EYR41_004670 [Orbilia oligospora]
MAILIKKILLLLLLNWINQVACQDQPFVLSFEGPQFQNGAITGRIQDPVQQFDLSDFTVIEAQPLPSGSGIPITSFKSSLLRPCSPSHYISRISPTFQDNITDRGKTVGIKIAPGPDGQPLFRSFDLKTTCLACIFVPAITQGQPLPPPLSDDPLTKVIAPASCDITIIGTKYSAPSSNQKTTVTSTVKFMARPVFDISAPTTLQPTGMGEYQFSDRWTDLISIEFRISNAKIAIPVGLPSRLETLLARGAIIDSLAIDNLAGTKHPGSGSIPIP